MKFTSRIANIILCSIVIFCYVEARHNVKPLCGFHGPNIVTFDPEVENCTDGKKLPLFPHKQTTESTKSSSMTTKASEFKEIERTCDKDSKSKGYKCCGQYHAYHPDFQTCCRVFTKIRIHLNSAEKENVCCGIDVYPRHAPSCRHPALNDVLWKAQPLRKETYEDLCSANRVYRAKINQKEKKAILRQLKPKGERFELDFKTDTYTPTSKLPKRGFILVTHKDLSKDDDFIATSKDKLFTVGNMCKFRRTLRRMCKRLRKRKNQLA